MNFLGPPPKFIAHLFLTALLLSAVYGPTAWAPFERHDDYYLQFFEPGMASPDNLRNQFYYASHVAQGRILLAEAQWVSLGRLYLRFPGVGFFVFLKCFNLAILILACGLLSYWMEKICRETFLLSVLKALTVFALPGFQFWVGQGLSASNTYALLWSMLSVVLLQGALEAIGRGRNGDSIARIAGSVLLLVLSFFTYQSDTLIFFLPLGALLFSSDSRVPWMEKRKTILAATAAYVFAGTIYWALQKWFVFPAFIHSYPHAEILGYGELSLRVSPLEALHSLANSFWNTNTWNLWCVLKNEFVAICFIAFGLISLGGALIHGLRAAAVVNRTREFCAEGIQKIALALVLLVAVQSPQILYGKFEYYRVIFAHSGLIVLFLISCVEWWIRIIGGTAEKNRLLVISGLALIVLLLAKYDAWTYYALPSLEEYEYLQYALQPLFKDEIDSVIIQRADAGIIDTSDEHGLYTSSIDNSYGLGGMVVRICRENNLPESRFFMRNLKPRMMVITTHTAARTGKVHPRHIFLNDVLKIHQSFRTLGNGPRFGVPEFRMKISSADR